MRILFVISVMGHGKGGHFHSLDHISRIIGTNLEISIITVGPGQSEVIENNPNFEEHIFFNGINLLKFNNDIKRVLTSFKPAILHFFDSTSYNIVRPFVSNDIKLIVNKCGGPNPIDFPRVDNLVLFSKENREWFVNKEKFKDTNISLIPNRTTAIVTTKNSEYKKEPDSFNLMRIARIGTAYIKSITDSILLLETLKELSGAQLKLYIIGTVQDYEVYNELMDQISNRSDIIIITDNKYTQQASKMLYLADAVIATGRGIMEASSLGLPILTPATNSKLPLLVNEVNFQTFFATNFSERNIASQDDLEKNINLVANLILDANYYNQVSILSKDFFDKYFNIDKALEKYKQAYLSAINSNKNRVAWYSDFFLKLKDFKRCYKHSK
ncbi:hypothetical protein JQC67_11475 [Aurantibacter crassamenti]|uniref:hypothetical protein n=1 Tax=Aurantibacter crassamenti TaxID=1837375 RepID=UPI00193A4DA8|nr:hypothetical protein [Aurantibacter crassamenti]MBM1106761.1 hypothetical protein [Aurantibacter crassamenti]